MARIKIKDLPKDMKISAEEMKRVKGGFTLTTSPLTSPTNFLKIDHKVTSLVDGSIEGAVTDPNLEATYIKW